MIQELEVQVEQQQAELVIQSLMAEQVELEKEQTLVAEVEAVLLPEMLQMEILDRMVMEGVLADLAARFLLVAELEVMVDGLMNMELLLQQLVGEEAVQVLMKAAIIMVAMVIREKW